MGGRKFEAWALWINILRYRDLQQESLSMKNLKFQFSGPDNGKLMRSAPALIRIRLPWL